MDHALSYVKNQVILIAISPSFGRMFNQSAFTNRIGVNHH